VLQRAVCFDLGGVVARISLHLAEMLGRCGLPVPKHISQGDDIHKMPGFEAYQAGDLTDEQYVAGMARYIGGISIADAMRVHRSMIIDAYPGVFEIVEKLNDSGIITGCLSNTNAPHWEDLAESGRFPAITAMKVRLGSHMIGAAKPDPRAFRAFEAAVGCRSAEILLFDDSPVNCEAARGLGWNAKRIDATGDPARQMRSALNAFVSGSLATPTGRPRV